MDEAMLLNAVREAVRSEVQPLAEKVELLDATMQAAFTPVYERLDKIDIRMETDIAPKLQLLAEGFQGYAERVPALDQMAADIAGIKENVAILANSFSERLLTASSKAI